MDGLTLVAEMYVGMGMVPNLPPLETELDHLWVAPDEVEHMARRLMSSNRELAELWHIPIRYLFTDREIKSQGRRIKSKTQVLASKVNILTTSYRFVITLDKYFWDKEPHYREGILYGALWACEVEVDEVGDLMFRVRKPDLHSYSQVLLKYPEMPESVEQLNLLPDPEELLKPLVQDQTTVEVISRG